MRRVSRSVHTEIYFWGCNPSFVVTEAGVVMIDTPQQPIDAVRWRERMLEHGPIRHLINTEPHSDHILGNAYFPGVEVIGHDELRQRYLDAVPQMTSPERAALLKQHDPDSVWLFNHPSYPPNPPSHTFTNDLRLDLGSHTLHCVHLPGHTHPQTVVHVPEEGVLLTGDNIFCRCKTFIQEADPRQWLAALDWIERLDVDVIVPGHGEPCDRSYVGEQRQVLQNWMGLVERFVDRGLTLDEALAEPLDMAAIDPYPIGQRLFAFEGLDQMIVRNLYGRISARQA